MALEPGSLFAFKTGIATLGLSRANDSDEGQNYSTICRIVLTGNLNLLFRKREMLPTVRVSRDVHFGRCQVKFVS